MPLIIDMQRGFNHMDRDNVKQLTLVALFAALVTVSIYLFRIPSFDGKLYFHLGETMMIAGAFILGKRNGALAAGIGSALADLLLGAPYWAPISFIIHGAQAWTIAALSDGKLEKKDLIAMGEGAVIVILGYCIAAWNIYGWVAVPMEFVGDILQTSFGIASAYAFMKALRRVKPDLFQKK